MLMFYITEQWCIHAMEAALLSILSLSPLILFMSFVHANQWALSNHLQKYYWPCCSTGALLAHQARSKQDQHIRKKLHWWLLWWFHHRKAKLAYMMETIIPSSMLFTASCQMTTAATDRAVQSCGGAYQVFKQVIFHMWNLDEVNSICVISKHHPLLCLRLLVIL